MKVMILTCACCGGEEPALNALGLTFEEVDAEVMREAMALAGGESEGDSL